MMSPRVGHPAKEGLRLRHFPLLVETSLPRVGHPAKEGLRPVLLSSAPHYTVTQSRSSSKRGIKTIYAYLISDAPRCPRVGHPAKEGLRRIYKGRYQVKSKCPE